MGKGVEVRFTVAIVSTSKGETQRFDYTLSAVGLPQQVANSNLCYTDLDLVRAVREGGPGGVVKGIRNWKQVNGSVAFFDESLVANVDTMVKNLVNHGACAAFLKVAPTVQASIPVFVLSGVQFQKMLRLKKDKSVNLKVSLLPEKQTGERDRVICSNTGKRSGEVSRI